MIRLFTGNRSPSITDTITVNGAPMDLTGSTVKFRMRPEDSTTLKVDSPATIVSAPAGTVRYDWAALDVDTPGDYIAWWQVTLPTGKTQDTPSFVVNIDDHYAPAETTLYVEAEEMKATLGLAGMTFADEDIEAAIAAASEAVNDFCGRRFYRDTLTTNTRTYPPTGSVVLIDDLVELGTNGISVDGTAKVLGTDYALEPANAPADGKPWTTVRWLTGYWPAAYGTTWSPYADGYWGTVTYQPTVSVQGRWGWPAVPSRVKEAAQILASRLLTRQRQAPFGVVGLGLDGSAVRIPSIDPDVAFLLTPLSIRQRAA